MVQSPSAPDTLYPDSDGQPMADNTKQYNWIVRLVSNLKVLLKDQTAFVAGDLLWYPIQVTDPSQAVPCQAPDAMVVLGRPAGDRGSYKQWEENNLAPQVVFEIMSPNNSGKEMGKKQSFYAEHGVLEMYFYDPDSYEFWGLVRDTVIEPPRLVTALNLPWTSPCLRIRFELFDDGLTVYFPDGEPFKDPEELAEELDATRQERDAAQQARDRFAAKLRELGLDPDQL
jgi:Uma2 family endonuclease